MAKKVEVEGFADAFGRMVEIGDKVGYIYNPYGRKQMLVSGTLIKVEEIHPSPEDYDYSNYDWNIYVQPDNPEQGYSGVYGKKQRPSILHFTDRIVFLNHGENS